MLTAGKLDLRLLPRCPVLTQENGFEQYDLGVGSRDEHYINIKEEETNLGFQAIAAFSWLYDKSIKY